MASFADIVKQFNLSEEQINEECSLDTIPNVHKEMTEWRNIAPYLFPMEAAKGIVETINQDLSLNDEGRRCALLVRWKQFHGSDATYKKLIEAFLSAYRRDLAEIVCKALNGGELYKYCVFRNDPGSFRPISAY